jgi:Kdo2-lipid IVA lauroyltransferase/acyltransferase
MMRHYVSFILIRLITFPALFLPYRALHSLGKVLGLAAYFLLPKFRKRTLSNLALALSLDESQLIKTAKEAMQNLMITCLEYPKLSWEKRIEKIAFCENPVPAREIIDKGQGIIFFCGHQANWELLFLEGTSRMPGVAIGRPVKNKILYDWVLSMRQKFGGKIITPQNAIREGFKALKRGAFLGIVGDQGMPDSGYSSPFFGRRAWSSPIAAILSYRTGSPLMVATTLREQGRYRIRYSEPIWPNREESMETEVDRMMRAALLLLEESIKEAPSQWLWQHNRWKQQTTRKIKRSFRQDTLLIILPEEKEAYDSLAPHLGVFRELYPLEFLTVMVPKAYAEKTLCSDAELVIYKALDECFIRDYRFKLVFNFTEQPSLSAHFLSLAAAKVVTLQDLSGDVSEALKKLVLHAV